ncbi:MAG: HEAT repeat domain-containing protein [Acidimicrobiia bacterium]
MGPASERRATAAEAGHTGDEAVARSLLADGDAGVRATALAALCRMGRASVADLERSLVDADPVVRRRAVALAVPVVEVRFAHLLGDIDPGVAEQAAWALGERDPAEDGSVAALARAAAGHDDPLVREAAVAALGSLGHPDGKAAVLAATTDRPAVRRRAVLALAAFDGPDVDAALQRALHDRDWQTRQCAETVLGA